MLAAAMMTAVASARAQQGAPLIAVPSLSAFRVDTAATSLPVRVLMLDPSPVVAALHAARPAGFYALTVRRTGLRECQPDLSYDADEHFLTVMLRVVQAQPRPDAGRQPATLPVLTVQRAGPASASAPLSPVLTVGAADLDQARDSNGDVMVQAEVEPADVPAVRRSLAVVLVFELGVPRPQGPVFSATHVRSSRRGSVTGTAAALDVVWARNLSAWLVDGRTGRVLTKHALGPRWTYRAP